MIQVFLHLPLTTELWTFGGQPTEGVFAIRQPTDKVNVGAKLPVCTACPDVSGSANNEHKVC